MAIMASRDPSSTAVMADQGSALHVCQGITVLAAAHTAVATIGLQRGSAKGRVHHVYRKGLHLPGGGTT